MGESILTSLQSLWHKNHGFKTWEEALLSLTPHQTDKEIELEQLK